MNLFQLCLLAESCVLSCWEGEQRENESLKSWEATGTFSFHPNFLGMPQEGNLPCGQSFF